MKHPEPRAWLCVIFVTEQGTGFRKHGQGFVPGSSGEAAESLFFRLKTAIHVTVSGVLPEERARKPSAKASQRSLVVLFYLFALCVLAPSCSSQQNIPPSPTSDFLDWSANTRREKTRLCVLPFEDANPPDGLAAIVRERVAGHLSVKRYTDIELHVIDTILEKMDLGSWRELEPSALGMKLGCDALVYGRVQKLQRIYVGIYSQLALEGTVQVVDVFYG